jgi:hypothetical protein
MLAVEDKSLHLSDAIEEATQYIIENDVPICDYIAIKDKQESQVIRLKEAVKRLNLIRKSQDLQRFKLLEVIDYIKEQKAAEAKPHFINKIMEIQKQVLQSQSMNSYSPDESMLSP